MEKFTPPTEEERQARRKLIHERMEAALKLRKEGKSPDYISVFPFQKKGAGADQPAQGNPPEGEGSL